ncbi:MAG: hypothetical protein H7320_18460 [Ferruginibacter sp.]|nr:hypothetical protein [Ferruginibacter sp.]
MEATQKLEVINEFKTKCPGWVNPDLVSIKYCQNDSFAFLEMEFTSKPGKPVLINLDFISDDFDPETVEEIAPLFKPAADVVDNAMVFVGLDTYSLVNCVDGLFTDAAASLIYEEYKKLSS